MSARQNRMTEERFLSVLQHELSSSVTWSVEHLQEDQLKNLQYYLGMPMGNEVKGRSQVVSWDVFEVVESAMPGFIEPFFSGDTIGKFEPKGPEDVQWAEQATDYVNHIIKERNAGFLLFNTWIKDALLSKVGVVRGEWRDEDPKRKQFRGLSDQQMTLLAQDPRTQIIEHAAQPIPGMPPMNPAQLIQMGGQVPMLHDVTVLQTQPGCVALENVRPENFILTSGIGTLDKARVIGEWVVYTRSELKELGFKQHDTAQSFDLATAVLEGSLQDVRDGFTTELALQDDAGGDRSLQEIRLFKGFIRADYNGDGVAEWRRVLVAGGEDPMLENEEAEGHNYCVLSPILIPHRVIGLGYADPARPIADVKTALTRQYLDSLYLANRPRTYVNLNANVSMDDMLSDRIGGFIRGRGPAGDALQPLQTTLVARDALEGLQLADNMRETRLGIPKYNPGLEADALHKTATGVRSINNLVDKRQKMTLRILAETGIKDLFRLVLKLVTEYQDAPAMVRLRGQFVQFDPRGWTPDMDVSIEVGVGTSDETETMMQLQQFGQFMAWGQQVGVVSPRNVHQFGLRLAKNARLKGAEQDLLTPPPDQPPPPPPDPKLALAQFEAQQEQQKFQAEAQIEQQRRQTEAQMQMMTDQNRQEWEARQKQLEAQQSAQIEQMRMEAEDRRHAQDLAFKQWQTEFQANQAIALEQMRQQAAAPQPMDMTPLIELLAPIAEHIGAPPRLVRDEAGRAVGVQKGARTYSIDRDAQGRPEGLSDAAHLQ